MWLTWTPWGPNSLARLWDNARTAHFADAKAAKPIEALMLAVAPVNSNVGGYFGLAFAVSIRSGIACWENRNPPMLCVRNEKCKDVRGRLPEWFKQRRGDRQERSFKVTASSASTGNIENSDVKRSKGLDLVKCLQKLELHCRPRDGTSITLCSLLKSVAIPIALHQWHNSRGKVHLHHSSWSHSQASRASPESWREEQRCRSH